MLASILMSLLRLAGGKAKQKALTSSPHVVIKICLTASRTAVLLVYDCQTCLEIEAM